MNKELEQSYHQLIETKQTFLKRIKEKTLEQQMFKPNEEGWNMVEIFEHIQLSEGGILGYFKKRPPAETEYKVDLKSKVAYSLLSQFYKLPSKVNVPVKGLTPKGNTPLENLIQQSDSNNDIIRVIIIDFPLEKLKYSVFKHPVSGAMTMQNTIDFFTNHILHHVHQLNRLEKHANYPKKLD
ncbi:MAG: hypothetical protein ACI94Y_001003 [Maribacter sp.]|jgi:hypothetical protein